MSNRILTIAIIGLGNRGGYEYGRYLYEHPDKYQITAICDTREDRLKRWGDYMNIPDDNRFISEEEFFKEKRADFIVIATMDKLHVRQAKKALDLGYDILLEKPISEYVDELQSLASKARETKRTVMVCHVLRYAVWIRKIKEIIDNGEIGQLISIDQTENVAWWHQAHSFVRGNWHNTKDSVPMIMAKCCHDLDLLQYFAHSQCESVSSIGDLRYFKPENKPSGAAKRCLDCKYKDTCTYSAKVLYIDKWHELHEEQCFPFTILCEKMPITEEQMYDTISKSEYGECVYNGQNNVVDNQITIMRFANGVTASLKMLAFTKGGGRDIRFYGSEGELNLLQDEDKIILKKFHGPTTTWKISEVVKDLAGHGGADHRMLDKIYDVIVLGDKSVDTSLDASIESHYMALAAEESRNNHGQVVFIDKYRK